MKIFIQLNSTIHQQQLILHICFQVFPCVNFQFSNSLPPMTCNSLHSSFLNLLPKLNNLQHASSQNDLLYPVLISLPSIIIEAVFFYFKSFILITTFWYALWLPYRLPIWASISSCCWSICTACDKSLIT